MKREQALYERVASLVAASPDPRAELLEIARLQSSWEQRRRRALWAGATLAAACVVAALVLFLRPNGPGPDPDVTDPVAFSRWAGQIQRRTVLGNVTAEEEARLRRSLDNPSSLARRAALCTLLIHHFAVSTDVLLRMGKEVNETIDLPVEVASRTGGDVAEALRDNRLATLRNVSRAIWIHCAREDRFPDVAFIEQLAGRPDQEIRFCAYHALGALRDYEPPPALIEQARSETSANLREAVAALLTRAGR